MRFLASHPNEPQPRDRLLVEVFGYGVGSRTVDTTVRRIRTKIEPDPKHPRRLLTVPGRGYVWVQPGANRDRGPARRGRRGARLARPRWATAGGRRATGVGKSAIVGAAVGDAVPRSISPARDRRRARRARRGLRRGRLRQRQSRGQRRAARGPTRPARDRDLPVRAQSAGRPVAPGGPAPRRAAQPTGPRLVPQPVPGRRAPSADRRQPAGGVDRAVGSAGGPRPADRVPVARRGGALVNRRAAPRLARKAAIPRRRAREAGPPRGGAAVGRAQSGGARCAARPVADRRGRRGVRGPRAGPGGARQHPRPGAPPGSGRGVPGRRPDRQRDLEHRARADRGPQLAGRALGRARVERAPRDRRAADLRDRVLHRGDGRRRRRPARHAGGARPHAQPYRSRQSGAPACCGAGSPPPSGSKTRRRGSTRSSTRRPP